MSTTTIRVDRATHQELKRLARERHSTVAETVARAVRVLRQEQMAIDLAQRLDSARPSGSMLTSGDIIEVYLGAPQGSEAGLTRPVIAVTAQRILARSPSVIQVVPLTRTIRGYATAVTITADDHNGLDARRAHRPGMLHLGGLCPLLPGRN